MVTLALATDVVGGRGDGEVVQRNATTGRTGILLKGTQTQGAEIGGEIAIEARVVADPHGVEVVGWQRLTQMTYNGTEWRGIFKGEVPAGEWYNWELRAVRRDGQVVILNATETNRWGVGDLVLLNGQSVGVDFVIDVDRVATATDVPDGAVAVYGPAFKWALLEDLDSSTTSPHNFMLTNATWVQSGKTLTQTGVFTSYTYEASDKVFLYGGGITAGLYTIASKTDNDTVVLTEDLGADTTGIIQQPRSNGMLKYLNSLQAAYTAASDDVPIGLVLGAQDSTAIGPEADYLSAGDWSANGTAFEVAKTALLAATGELTAAVVLWQQGENEATAPVFDTTTEFVLSENYYALRLKELAARFTKEIRGVGSADTTFVVGTVAGSTQYNPITSQNVSLDGAYDEVREQQVRTAVEEGYGLCALAGAELTTDGLHLSQTGQSTFGTRLAEVTAGALGLSGKPTTGPRIIKAVFGDPFALASGTERSRNRITLYVEHDTGTDLTVPANAARAFQVHDEYGPLYVSAVGKGTTADGVQPLVLSLTRDTSQTPASVDRPYVAPALLSGNVAWVRYAPFPDWTATDQIVDNATVTMPLLSTYGVDSPEKDIRLISTPLASQSNYVAGVLRCGITSELGAVVTLDAPTDASPGGWHSIGEAFNQIRPGDRFIVEDDDPEGAYITSGTISAVTSYTDEDTTVQVTMSHDAGAAGMATTHFFTVFNVSKSAGAIVAVAPNSMNLSETRN